MFVSFDYSFSLKRFDFQFFFSYRYVFGCRSLHRTVQAVGRRAVDAFGMCSMQFRFRFEFRFEFRIEKRRVNVVSERRSDVGRRRFARRTNFLSAKVKLIEKCRNFKTISQ